MEQDPKYHELLEKLSKAETELDIIVIRSENKKLMIAYGLFFNALSNCFDYISKKYLSLNLNGD
jgi:hypothetical protein